MLAMENNKFANKDRYYHCGSPNLKNYLEDNEVCFIHHYRHKNNKTIWVYIKSEKVKELLKNWTNNKPIK